MVGACYVEQQVSDEAVLSLTSLLRSVEAKLRWPSSQLCSLMRMLPKPSGGHRLIVLTGGLYRLWSQVRRPVLVDWVAQQSLIAHWDYAVRGSCALRVALLRACRAEACKLSGVAALDVPLDITKLYDSVLPGVQAKKAVELDYPMLPLYLGLLAHLSVRVVSPRGVFGESAFAMHGILAGCGQSPDWAKVYLFDIFQAAVDRWAPVRWQTWVDDIHQSMVGSTQAIIARMLPAAMWLKNRMAEVSCEFASKSFFMATA